MFGTRKKVEKQIKLNVSDFFFNSKFFGSLKPKINRLEMHEEITGTRIFL